MMFTQLNTSTMTIRVSAYGTFDVRLGGNLFPGIAIRVIVYNQQCV